MTSNSSLPNPFDSVIITNGEGTEVSILENVTREFENSDVLSHKPNFPPFYPIFFHHISFEIPPKRLFLVRLNFITALSITFSLLFSFFASFFSILFQTCNNISCFNVCKEIFLSLFNLIIETTLLFYNQYYPFYISMRNEMSNNHLIIVQFFTIGILFVQLLGIPGTGSIGIVYLYASFETGKSINQFLSTILSIWHFIDFLLEIVILFLMKPIIKTSNIATERVQITI